MKAKLFAIVLSLSLLSNFCLAANSPDVKTQPPSQTIHKKINLNTASATELMNSFKGIGKKRAENIVNYRNEHGKYKDIADLANVKGIGENFVKKNADALQATYAIE